MLRRWRRWRNFAFVRQFSLFEEAKALSMGHSIHGFDIEVRPSSIPNSGQGVFVSRAARATTAAATEAATDTSVPMGALVALYAGIWFPAVPYLANSENSVVSCHLTTPIHTQRHPE